MKTNLPLLIMNDFMLFPCCEIKKEVNDSKIKKILDISEKYYNNYVFLSFINNNIGVVAKITLRLDMPNGYTKVNFKGIIRCHIVSINQDKDIDNAYIENIQIPQINPTEHIAKSKKIKELFLEYLDNKKSLGNSIIEKINNINDLGNLTDIIGDFMPLNKEKKEGLINEVDPIKRYELLKDDIAFELSLLNYENSLDNEIEKNLEEGQKKYILKEKLKLIEEELGIKENSDTLKLQEKIDKLECPTRIKNKLYDELERYKVCNSNSPEIGIIKNYIETLLSIPWNISSRENYDIDAIKKSLDESHYGLEDVKERIIEFMATKKHTKSKHNPIICLVGPPGIGKTSISKAISAALKRKCVKISVGGINDEAEITGHRRAYVGALPGKIISGIIKAGVNNPVFIIDEIDKMTKDIKGDPASALLEVLDYEQNSGFTDHFVEEEFDLSKVMFILTANYLENIPTELKDRLEIIELSSYTSMEKVMIVKNSLLKRLRMEYHLTKQELNLSDKTILYIIEHYTRESGIRDLERLLRKICRKFICYKIANNENMDINKHIKDILGSEKYNYQENYDNEIGMMNVLSYHPLGGELIKIETGLCEGSGNIKTTGLLGDVMKESINVAMAYLKTHVKEFKLDNNIFKNNDFFIHFTNNGIKKEGPSAGVSITTAILSLLKNKKISNDIAMTGEITLTGKILKVGGLKEKIILAVERGIKKVFLPLENENDILEYHNIYENKLNIVFVDNYLDIYKDLFKNLKK